MRALSLALLVTAACGSSQIQNLPLSWRGTDQSPQPSPIVAQAFAAAPVAFGLRDMRPDPSAVGLVEEDGWIVRTSDNVAQFCSNRLGEILQRAGARMNEAPLAVLETELLEFRVVEGSTFAGKVRIRAVVRHNGSPDAWSQVYEGKSKRWGKSHNPDNYNEALTNALTDATGQMLKDEGFARALVPGELPRMQPASAPASAPPPPPGR